MTAFGAVCSLKNTLEDIDRCPRYSLVGRSEEILEVVYRELVPWGDILLRLNHTSPSRSRKNVNALDGIIKDAIWKFEDSLESLLTQQIPSQLEKTASIDLQSLQKDAYSLIQNLYDMKEYYIYQVENMPQDEPVSSKFGFHGTNSKMIGLSDQFQKIKTRLMKIDANFGRVYSFYGMAGIGKTTLARQIYQDADIQSIYECRAWVTVGRVPQPITQILQGINAQLSGIALTDLFPKKIDGKHCLVVLDDVWDDLVLSALVGSLPNTENGCTHVLVTYRHRMLMSDTLAVFPGNGCEVRFLNEKESTDLLCDKVFGDEGCPPQLHKAAIKIAKLCEGLPLMIVTIADFLSKSEHIRDLVYWKEVAERRNSVFTDAYNEISKVLFPSYNYLPEHLKMPFLFMGVFPQDNATPLSKIIIMLTAEGLWYDTECLRTLSISYNLVLHILKSVDKTTSPHILVDDFKNFRLHSSWRHVCRVEASKNKLYHVLNKLTDDEGLKDQRGLCLENNILFGIKEFRNSVTLDCASSSRSLLFYGPYQQYPVCIDVGFRLLREIDALTQRFYTFPVEILSLVQLKYLALTCNGELPATISKLFNLRALIIHPHLKIRRCRAPSYIPIQIWDMQDLEHIEILGKSLVAPSHVASLEKLSTLVGVNASICSVSELSKRIPNIKKFGVEIELTPYDDHNDLLCYFDYIATLGSLETLKFSITNPVIKRGHVVPVSPRWLTFPRNLRKLHLSGMGFPWKYLDVVGYLPSLIVLKLRSYAFQGSHWKTKRYSFKTLEFLLIEESDLVQWKPGFQSFPMLKYLSMKHCYKLEEIHRPHCLNEPGSSVEIELVDCNPLALTWARQLQLGFDVRLRVVASSSFYEKVKTIKIQRRGDTVLNLESDEEENDDEENANWEENDDEENANWEEDEIGICEFLKAFDQLLGSETGEESVESNFDLQVELLKDFDQLLGSETPDDDDTMNFFKEFYDALISKE
ncbi:putative late blight resistance protein homolog R1B-12 [Salvia hispanica]|uniref:putative late blight resistance protein homolog R1B-12 n=1 Tax=Salvia hispanica TaxID=49212 RepID=UPI0020096973|nr:putative late blight resistance protein homolog R1B-12 [Salvia hispanica]XP_047974457.1 putative late blight resistance protein homolog R1B-12 [Salvia hispanica]